MENLDYCEAVPVSEVSLGDNYGGKVSLGADMPQCHYVENSSCGGVNNTLDSSEQRI